MCPKAYVMWGWAEYTPVWQQVRALTAATNIPERHCQKVVTSTPPFLSRNFSKSISKDMHTKVQKKFSSSWKLNFLPNYIEAQTSENPPNFHQFCSKSREDISLHLVVHIGDRKAFNAHPKSLIKEIISSIKKDD